MNTGNQHPKGGNDLLKAPQWNQGLNSCLLIRSLRSFCYNTGASASAAGLDDVHACVCVRMHTCVHVDEGRKNDRRGYLLDDAKNEPCPLGIWAFTVLDVRTIQKKFKSLGVNVSKYNCPSKRGLFRKGARGGLWLRSGMTGKSSWGIHCPSLDGWAEIMAWGMRVHLSGSFPQSNWKSGITT